MKIRIERSLLCERGPKSRKNFSKEGGASMRNGLIWGNLRILAIIPELRVLLRPITIFVGSKNILKVLLIC